MYNPGRGSYGKAYARQQSAIVQKIFLVLDSIYWYYIMLFFVILHCALLFFDRYETSWHGSNDPRRFTFMTVEAVCLVLYIVDIVMIIIYYSPKVINNENDERLFTRLKEIPKVQYIQLAFTVLFFFDFVYYHAFIFSLQDRDTPPKRVFVCLRAFQFLVKKKTVLHIFWVTVKTVIGLLNVLVGILGYVMFFACIAVHLFAEIYHKQAEKESNEADSTNDGVSAKYEKEFDQVLKAFMRLFVLLTTENYPDVMIPAYKTSKWTFIFFSLFLFIGKWRRHY